MSSKETWIATLLVVVVATASLGCSTRSEAERPNFLFILADDLDARLVEDHLSDYPNLQALSENGVTFDNAFVTNSLCCPGRATLLTGLYSHNHGVMTNEPPDGGASEFRSSEPDALPVWLDEAGYKTAYVGRYLNGYDRSYAPPGWDEWRGQKGKYSENADTYPSVPLRETTDFFSDQANDFVEKVGKDDKPFFLQVSTRAPHAPATPPERHKNLFSNARMPRSPSFNERNLADKPDWLRGRKMRSEEQIAELEDLYRQRLRSMMAVDEMVGRLVETLENKGLLENTYIFFTSDHGYHMGEHRLPDGKRLAYEEDIRVPLISRGPQFPAGAAEDEMVLNNDLAPTISDLAGTESSAPMDGRSLLPLLNGQSENWRNAFLVEAAEQERINRPPYKAVRTRNHTYVEYANGEQELYDLREDPHQLQSRHRNADERLLRSLQKQLAALRECSGEACRRAENE